ncbi:hypothetical protein SDC9_212433 [bioreactor metagenome]|uniref:Uncharacterized protein n=1 Tax=bioreactor metagenome TaxID=1076179 RepID=A0A645JMU1_9ZZZZ
MLENAAHQHPFITCKAVFCPVAVVHIEVDDGNALQAMGLDGMHRCDTDVVEEAEAHGRGLFAMMTRRANRAERILDFALHDEIHCMAASPGRT